MAHAHPPAPQPPLDPDGEPHAALRRPLSTTIRRHRVFLLAVLCLLSSAIFLLAPLLGRSYDLSGSMKVSMRPYEPLPELASLPEAALKQYKKDPVIEPTLSRTDPTTLTLQLQASAPSRHTAFVQLHSFAEGYSHFLRQGAQDLLDTYRTNLSRQQTRLANSEQDLTQKIEEFRTTHPGILADDPNSVVTQYNNLASRLEEKQQSLRVRSEYLGKLREHKRTIAARGAQAAPPPPPPPVPEAPTTAPAAAGKPENDPEVITLNAQLQLLTEQIEVQLRTRQEQHPYVQDLRTQEVNLQKKLEAAKQRAASGAPAPTTVRPLQPVPAAGTVDPTLAAAQKVDLDIASAEAEHDTLKIEIQTLSSQRDALKKEVDRVGPARITFEKMQKELEALKKDRQANEALLTQYDRRFPKEERPASAMPGSIRISEPLIDITPLAMADSSTLPSFPRLPLIYTAGLLLGLLASGGLAVMLHRTDRTFHHPGEVGTLLGVPVLGAVSEIRTPGVRRVRRLWTSFGRPVLSVLFICLMLASAVQCYRHLADPGFTQNPKILSFLSPGPGDDSSRRSGDVSSRR